MLANSFILGKDALNKAKSFDERHRLTLNASATVASIDRKMGLSEKLSMGMAVVNESVREMDERFQVYEKTKSALAAAEQKASTAGSSITSNRYVLTRVLLGTSPFSAVTKAAKDVSTMIKEKVEKAKEENETLYRENAAIINDFAKAHLDNSPVGELLVAVVTAN